MPYIFKQRPPQSLVGSGTYVFRHYGPRLPHSFQEVEYIGTSGTQYIVTNITSAGNVSCDIRAAITGWSKGYCCIVGNINTNSYYRYLPKEGCTSICTDFNSTEIAYNYSFSMNTIYNWKITGGKYYLNDSLVTDRSSEASFTGSTPLYLFGDNTNGSVYYYSQLQCYEAKFYNSSMVLTHDFIPCYATESVTAYQGTTATTAAAGTIGMYDLVNDRFYINSGTGTFTKGQDVVN